MSTSTRGPSGPHREKLGTFTGMYKPVLFTQWGVLLFVRFSIVVGYTGWAMAIGFCFLAMFNQSLTTLSLCTMMSNSPPRNGRIMDVFSANVGQSMAGTICIMYYLGLTFMGSVEMMGAIQAFAVILLETPGLPDTLTGSQYTDQVVLGIPTLVVMTLIRAFSPRAMHVISITALCAVVLALSCGIIGLCATSAGWQVDLAAGITGLNLTTLYENTWQDFTEPANASASTDISDASVAMGIIYPSFLGVFEGANVAHKLKNPERSVVVGTFGALMTSGLLYTVMFLLFAAVAKRETLKLNILLFANLTWPTKYIGYVGAVVVGIGSSMEMLEIAPVVLQAIAAADVFTFFKYAQLADMTDQEPRRAVLVTAIIQFCLIFVASQYFDTLAQVVAVFVLTAYASLDIALFINEVIRLAGWRPTFKYFHWGLALFGFCATTAIAIFLNPTLYFVTIALIGALLFYVKVVEEPKVSGLGSRGIHINGALRFLLNEEYLKLEDDEATDDKRKDRRETHSFWTPQLLGFVDVDPDTGAVTEPKLLDFVYQVQSHSRVISLTILANVQIVPDRDMNLVKRETLRSRANARRKIKKKLMSQIVEADIKGFCEVVSAPTLLAGRSILMESLGIGALRPNLIVAEFPAQFEIGGECNSNTERNAVGRQLLQLYNESHALQKACIVLKGLRNFPESMGERLAGTIDVWWVINTGGLQLLLAYLLTLNRVWKRCQIRLFVPVLPLPSEGGDLPSMARLLSVQRDVEKIVSAMRLNAEVVVHPLSSSFGKDILFEADRTAQTKVLAEGTPSNKLAEAFAHVAEDLDEELPMISAPTADALNEDPADANGAHSESRPASGRKSPVNVKSLMTHFPLPHSEETTPSLRSAASEPLIPQKKELGRPLASSVFEKNHLPRSTSHRGDLLRSNHRQVLKAIRERDKGLHVSKVISELSKDAQLVIINLPSPQKEHLDNPGKYTKMVARISETMNRVVFLTGTGEEVISIESRLQAHPGSESDSDSSDEGDAEQPRLLKQSSAISEGAEDIEAMASM